MDARPLFPKPDLLSARRVLAVQPHYDDNDMGAGGTLSLLSSAGAEIIYLTVMDDLAGVLDPNLSDSEAAALLKQEQAAAGQIIGVKHQLWLGCPDAGDFDYFELRRRIIAQIRLLRPDFILTVDPWLLYEAHQDHIRVGRAVSESLLLYNLPRVKSDSQIDSEYQPYNLTGIAFYFTPAPNTWIDIQQTHIRKHQALDSYQAQFTSAGLDELHQTFAAIEQKAGQKIGAALAEEFKVLKPGRLPHHDRYLHFLTHKNKNLSEK